MRVAGKRLNWRIGFAAGTLIYVAWVVHLSLPDFDKVHREYRRAVEKLRPARIEIIARQELVDLCRKEALRVERLRSTDEAAAVEGTCLSWPTVVLEERQRAVKERLISERSRAGRKLGLFYFTFVAIFLFLPPLVMYLWLVSLIRVFRNTKVVK